MRSLAATKIAKEVPKVIVTVEPQGPQGPQEVPEPLFLVTVEPQET